MKIIRKFDFVKFLRPEYMPWWAKLIVAIGLSLLIAGIYYYGVYIGFNYGYDAALNIVQKKYECVLKPIWNTSKF